MNRYIQPLTSATGNPVEDIPHMRNKASAKTSQSVKRND